MSMCSCNYKCNCSVAAVIASIIVGVIAAFLQITAVITVSPVFLWVLFGIAIVFLGVLVIAAALGNRGGGCTNQCSVLSLLLLGILGTILFTVILLTVGITATSIISAILIGLLLFFFTLTLVSLTCYVKCLSDCGD